MATDIIITADDFADDEPTPSPSPKASSGAAPEVLMSEDEFLPAYADGVAPGTALNRSPVSPEERQALSFGNEKGKLSYLKKRYDGAEVNEDGDFVVKKDGLWHRVDPSGLGDVDAWKVTKNILSKAFARGHTGPLVSPEDKASLASLGRELESDVKDLSDLVAPVAGATLGAGKGAALAGGPANPVGAALGGIAGAFAGGAGGKAANVSLGRLAGTYDATPEETAKDIAWEGLLAAGGQTVGLGVKPGWEFIKKSFGKMGTKASNTGREMLSQLWADATNGDRWAFRRAMDSADDVVGKADRAWQAVGDSAAPTEAIGYAQGRQVGLLRKYTNMADGALSKKYEEGLTALRTKVPTNFRANVVDIMAPAQQQLVQMGVAKPVVSSGGKWLGVKFDAKSSLLTKETQARLGEFVEITNKAIRQYGYRNGQPASLAGKDGAEKLLRLKKTFNTIFDDVIGDDLLNTPVGRAATQFKEAVETGVGNSFAKAGAGKEYLALNDGYSQYADAVKLLKNALRNQKRDPNALDNVVKRLASKGTANRGLKEEVRALADLVPGRGEKVMQGIIDWEAAKQMIDVVPKTFQGGTGTTALRMMATPLGQTSPRFIGKQIAYGSKVKDFFKNMSSSQLDSFLKDDATIADFIRTTAQAVDGEDDNIRQLLEGGVP